MKASSHSIVILYIFNMIVEFFCSLDSAVAVVGEGTVFKWKLAGTNQKYLPATALGELFSVM